ncbi:unnamed protein product [Trifolium pratense]|uniref:Uncharacterized protein n=1 Tax=Trifolium pratense TaxID=57577 RepID=A0ACB0LJW5_TRIPR|nr:unnamed protein product [Trifolium pratense]
MLIKCYVALFLALVFVMFYASIDAKHQENYQTINDEVLGIKITFTNQIYRSEAEKSVNFDCGERGTFVLGSQHHVIWAPANKVLICHASWNHSKATITALDPHKDLVFRQNIYWHIGPDALIQTIDFFPHRRVSWEPQGQK